MDHVERIEDIWADDLVGRWRDADFLEQFLVNRMTERKEAGIKGAYVINIDARWGAGKSFFLERFGRQLAARHHIVAEVNAWRDDHFDDPFVAVLAAIDDALRPFTKSDKSKATTLWKSVKRNATPIVGKALVGAGKTLFKRYVGSELDELIISDSDQDSSPATEAIATSMDSAAVEIERIVDATAEQFIQSFSRQNQAVVDFRTKLGSAIEALGSERRLPLFILIDELDRCRPSYAVALLERVKHLFDADNVVFVFATNTDQLQHSVNGAYGPGFDGFRYLKRFFDRTYVLPEPSTEALVRQEARHLNTAKVRAPTADSVDFLVEACRAYSMDLRQVKHVMDIVLTVVSAWPFRTTIDLVALLPLAVEFDRSGKADWNSAKANVPKLKFTTGKNFNFETQREETHVISVPDAFALIVEGLNLDNAKSLANLRNASATSMYVRDTFILEWNGQPTREGQRSNLAYLVDLISQAGRLDA